MQPSPPLPCRQMRPRAPSLCKSILLTVMKSPSCSVRPCHASESDEDEELCSTLDVFELNAAPEFQAISYTWGPAHEEPTLGAVGSPPELSESIRCSGHLVAITKNLSNALGVLREIAGNHMGVD